jgi:hypothetical protein
MLTMCNFSEASWNVVANRFNLPSYDGFSSATYNTQLP